MQQRNSHELLKRYIFFFLGICLNAFGIALFTHSKLGTGPTSCIPYVVSLKSGLSFGTCTFMFNILLLLGQIILLRKNFPRYQLLQLPVTLLFSILIDGAMKFTTFVNTDIYWIALLYNILGCVFRAVGVSCQVVADVVMLSTEAFVKALSDVSKKEFSWIKLFFDVFMAAVAIALSFLLLGRLESVREGTLIIVLLVGPVSHYFTKRLSFTNYVFENESELVFEPKLKISNSKRIVITVTSEAGSGGRIIAKILGIKLKIPVYDKELVDLIAQEGGFTKRFVQAHNEILYRSTAEAFIQNNFSVENFHSKSYTRLYEAQERVISKLAERQNCIIVGHCSNFILKNNKNVMNILITADMKNRITYISEKYGLNRHDSQKKIRRQDHNTWEFYLHFTNQDWKDSGNYHLCLNSSLFGYEETADIIEDIVKKNYTNTPSIKVKELITKYKLK